MYSQAGLGFRIWESSESGWSIIRSDLLINNRSQQGYQSTVKVGVGSRFRDEVGGVILSQMGSVLNEEIF